MLLLALVFYLHYEAPEEEQNFAMVMEMLRAAAIEDEEDNRPSPLDNLFALTLMMGMSMSAFAATDDPLTVVNNLSDFIFGLIRAIGLILLGFGIVQVGLSLKSHDPSQRANGFLTLAGGVIITFAKEILTLITG